MKIFNKVFINKTVFAGATLAVLSACSTQDIQSRDRLDYKSAVETNPLELPPSLSANANRNNAMSLRDFYQQTTQKADARVLVSKADMRIDGEGNDRYLSIATSPDTAWNALLAVIRDAGLVVGTSNPEAGVLETNWAENRADIPDGFMRKTLSKVGIGGLYSAATRDMYKARLERRGNNVLVFISHYGMKDKSSGSDDQFHTWQDRPSDPQLSGALLNRLYAKLAGVSDSRIAGVQRAVVVPTQDSNIIQVNRDIQTAWKQVGDALDDGAQLKVEQQDTNTASYIVAWQNPAKAKGAFKKLAFWSADVPPQRFKVNLLRVDNNRTQVSVAGLGDESSADVQFIMNKLRNQLF